MTTAPDLPVDFALAPPRERIPPQAAPLALVPAPAPAVGDELIVDFDEALRLATPRLQRYATRRLQDAHEAEEVVQEALLRAFQHRDSLRSEDDLMAWLTVVTGRLVIDRVRVRSRMTPVAELPPTSRTGRDTADVVVARDEARIALDALEAMPSRQAAVLWAREVEGLSYDDISERFGLSEPTVRSLLHRARRTLRREYADRGGTLPTMGLVALAPWLHGVRVAGRLRDLARRAAGVSVASATGLAVATVLPLWSHQAPAEAHAAPTPVLAVKAVQEPAPPTTAPRHVIRARATRTPAHDTAAPPTRTVDHRTPHLVTATCVKSTGVNCSPPSSPTLYLQLGRQDVGIANDVLPVSCTSLPETPITHCEPSDGNN